MSQMRKNAVYEMISGKKTRRKIVVFSIVAGSVLTAFFVATISYLHRMPFSTMINLLIRIQVKH